MSETYEVYGQPRGPQEPAAASGAEAEGADPGGWQIMVEFSAQGNAKPPTRVTFYPSPHATFAQAVAEARQIAVDHEPPDPYSPQGRQVYADGEGRFLTVIQGAMREFHFSTRVVRLLERS